MTQPLFFSTKSNSILYVKCWQFHINIIFGSGVMTTFINNEFDKKAYK